MSGQAAQGDGAPIPTPAARARRLTRAKQILVPLGMGAVGALGYPFRVPFCGEGPMFDGAPRELCLFIFGAWIYAQLTGPLPLKRQFYRVAWASFGFYAVLISWLDIAMERFGGMSGWEAWPAVMALFALCAVLTAGVVPVFAVLRGRGPWTDAMAFAIAWTVTEWARGASTQFPWGQWSMAMARLLPLCQWAAWGGFYLVTFWTALFAAGLCDIVRAPAPLRRKLGGRWAVALSVVMAIGAARFTAPMMPKNAPWPTLQVGVVQASISQTVKNNARAHRSTILQTYRDLSVQASRLGAKLLVWPEGAWPGYLPGDVSRLPTEPLDLPLLTGVGLFEEGGPEGPKGELDPPKIFNSALFVDANLTVQGRYDKQKLVPFGEYVPLRQILPVSKLVPGSFDCTPGEGGVPLGTEAMGVLICYDGVYPEPARRHVRAGAKFLVNLTNDAWYGLSSAPYQHRDYYVLRAIESGRYIVRAANSGISLQIDPMGRMTSGTALNASVAEVMRVPMAPASAQTLYVRIGDVWLYACLAAVVAALLRVALRI